MKYEESQLTDEHNSRISSPMSVITYKRDYNIFESFKNILFFF